MKNFLLLLMASFLLVLSACGSSEVETVEEKEEEITEEEFEEMKEELIERVKEIEEEEVEEQGKGEQEVSEFVTDFNNLASLPDDVEPLLEDVEVDDTGAQVLYTSDEYGIVVVHDNELIKYTFIFTKKDFDYKEVKGTGLNAMLHVATTLELDIDKLLVKFKESLPKEMNFYFDEDYTIKFSNEDLTGGDFGMIIEFVEL